MAQTGQMRRERCESESLSAESRAATDKRKEPRYRWFRANYGDRCWELDAMDPNDLRDCVEQAIIELIEPVAWQRCETINKAEQESLRTILEKWRAP